MSPIGLRWLAAATVFGFAALFTGIGISLSTAEEPKSPDLSELRDALKAAAKRGDNVGEIRKAFDALDQYLAKGWTAPKPGEKASAPAELKALREAVDAAARKGENVDAIRKELEVIEKAMTGQTLAKPMPQPPPEPPPFRPAPGIPFNNFPQPAFPGGNFGGFGGGLGGGGVDRELLQKAQELRLKGMELMLKNPTDAEAQKFFQEAQELMAKALVGGIGGLNPGAFNPGMMPLPDLNLGRGGDRFRLGIRMERLAPITAEQLGLENKGVAITTVIPGSAAEKAGFKVHDIVLEFAGKAISDDPTDLSERVNDVKVGEKVDAVVLRKGKKVELKGIEIPEARQVNPMPPQLRLQPQPLPNLNLPPRPNIKQVPRVNAPRPINPNAGVDGRAFNSVSVSQSNGEFTIKAVQNGVNYVVTGTSGDGMPVVDKVTITDGDKKPVEAASVKDVPENYRATVEKLVQSLGRRR